MGKVQKYIKAYRNRDRLEKQRQTIFKVTFINFFSNVEADFCIPVIIREKQTSPLTLFLNPDNFELKQTRKQIF